MYDAGYAKGQAEGGDTEAAYQQGVTDGKQAEYDAFWDAYQDQGTRTNYQYAFAGVGGWDRNNFKPKYDITGLFTTTFHYLNYGDKNWESFDLVEHLEKLGVTLDFSQSQYMTSMFMWAWIGRIGVVDCRSVQSHLQTAFSHGKIKTIDKLIVKENLEYTNTFQKQTGLVNITFEGVIGKSISFVDSPLLSNTEDSELNLVNSVQSIIDHLKDLTGQTRQTLTLHATVGAKLTDAQKSAAENKNWSIVY